ncbi:MAG: L,D-transpeptidase family protein [Rhodospirillaceae bacterium]|jgi:L,D-peptidoglycan transpeptidase YkuD (ErfK/YbiS/YcfS/YnhG family)|nr:L,D-transpeptidase family protein [Rhodospirillaceae bacterium]
MDLLVSAIDGHLGRAEFNGRVYDCAIGRTGIVANKAEGDGASPVGRFRLTQVLYRPDRGNPPATSIPCGALTVTDGWCDAPEHADYNRAVTLPHPARCETMWREDGLYDIVVITDHNSDPVVAGNGSGIFVHIAGGTDYPPTRGCVAFAPDDLKEILKDWNPDEDRLVIGQTD